MQQDQYSISVLHTTHNCPVEARNRVWLGPCAGRGRHGGGDGRRDLAPADLDRVCPEGKSRGAQGRRLVPVARKRYDARAGRPLQVARSSRVGRLDPAAGPRYIAELAGASFGRVVRGHRRARLHAYACVNKRKPVNIRFLFQNTTAPKTYIHVRAVEDLADEVGNEAARVIYRRKVLGSEGTIY